MHQKSLKFSKYFHFYQFCWPVFTTFITGGIGVTVTQGRRRKQLLDDLKET